MLKQEVDVPASADSSSRADTSNRRPVANRRTRRLMTVVRRVHMYTGLLMFPWVLIFGISGMLFNHPNVGEQVTGARLDPATLESLTGIRPWNPEQAAAQLVDQINNQDSTGAGPYTLDSSYVPEFHGIVLFRAEAPTGRNLMVLDVSQGTAILSTRHARPKAEPPPFASEEVRLEGFSVADLDEKVEGLLEARDLPSLGPLEAHPRIAPSLRLRVRDVADEQWNVTYNLGSGEVGGRRTDKPSDIGLNQLLGMLHKTHHYTMSPGALWFWAFFEDLLGLTLVLWAGSGLMMWWQIKKTRVIGVIAILLALVIGTWVLTGTAQELTFGEVQFKLSP